MSLVKRIKTVLAMVVVMVTALMIFAATAQAQPTDIFFVPPQEGLPDPGPTTGITGQCDDTTDPIESGSCTILQFGPPSDPPLNREDLVCDIPVSFVVEGQPTGVTGFQCRVPEPPPVEPPPEEPPPEEPPPEEPPPEEPPLEELPLEEQQATAIQYDDGDETNITNFCNQVIGVAAQQIQDGDANAAAVDESEAAAAAANELGISIDAALACFESASAAGDLVIAENGVIVVEEKVYEEVAEQEVVHEEEVVHEDVVVHEGEAVDEDDEMAVLPDTGGATLLALGAGALLVGGGLLARRILR